MARLAKITLILLSCFGLTFADYHYASHEGSNEYPYTSWETAADSMQNALDAADPGDTLYIGAGDWYQYVDGYDDDSVAIIGMGIDNTICHYDSVNWSIFHDITNGCLIEGISFTDMPHWPPQGTVCIYGRLNAGFTVNNCRFLRTDRAIGATGHPTMVTNCVFDSCSEAISGLILVGDFIIRNNLAMHCYGDDAFHLYCESAIVENNIILDGRRTTATDGIVVDGLAEIRNNIIINARFGIASNPHLQLNNTVAEMWTAGISVDHEDSVINNLVLNCNYSIWAEEGPAISYNALWGNDIDITFSNYPPDSIGNIFYNPMLVSDYDVHLQAFSPLIDGGHPDYLDVDGSRSDIGAYGGPLGEVYEYQDLPPAIPDSISGQYNQDTVRLIWLYNTEADFSHYQLHRDTLPGFEPSVFNQIAEPETSFYSDTDVTNEHNYYYRIASVDNQGNISAYSEEYEVLTTGIWDQPGATLPQITGIKTNYPNPFNGSTTIVYSVANLGPIPAEIKIDIYDVAGRKIRTLLNERRDIGEHRVIWDGKDDSGYDCSTGVYFARISQWGLMISDKPKKLVLVK